MSTEHEESATMKSLAYIEAQDHLARLIAHYRHREDRSGAFLAVECLGALAILGWREPRVVVPMPT